MIPRPPRDYTSDDWFLSMADQMAQFAYTRVEVVRLESGHIRVMGKRTDGTGDDILLRTPQHWSAWPQVQNTT